VRTIFKDNKLEKEISENGYLVLDLFSEKEIEYFYQIFENQKNNISENFHSSHFSLNRTYKKTVNDKFNEILQQKGNSFLENYNALFSNFMIKGCGNENTMPLHADWSYVDENHQKSIAFWFPLIDTDEKNGTLGVIPKSHLFPITLRGPRIESPFHDFNEYIISTYGKLLSIKKGQCVVYDHRLLHFSPSNKSNKVRPAINTVFIPDDSSLFHVLKTETTDEIRMYNVSESSFFVNYEHYSIPDGEYEFSIIDQKIIPFSKREIDGQLNNNPSRVRTKLNTILSRLFPF
jgi:hypothetical protein